MRVNVDDYARDARGDIIYYDYSGTRIPVNYECGMFDFEVFLNGNHYTPGCIEADEERGYLKTWDNDGKLVHVFGEIKILIWPLWESRL